MTIPATTPAAISVDEFCNSLSIGRTTFYRDLKSGLIKAVKRGGRTLVPFDELQAYLRRLGYDDSAA